MADVKTVTVDADDLIERLKKIDDELTELYDRIEAAAESEETTDDQASRIDGLLDDISTTAGYLSSEGESMENFVFSLRLVFVSEKGFDGSSMRHERTGYYTTQARALDVVNRIMLPGDRIVSLTIKAIPVEE